MARYLPINPASAPAAPRLAQDRSGSALAPLAQASATTQRLMQAGDTLAAAGDRDGAASKYRHALAAFSVAESHLARAAEALQQQQQTLFSRVAAAQPSAWMLPTLPHSVGAEALQLDDPNSRFDFRNADYTRCVQYVAGLAHSGNAVVDVLPHAARAWYVEGGELLVWWARKRFSSLGPASREAMRKEGEKFLAAARALA